MIKCNIVVYFPRAGLLLFCFFILLHIEICNCLHMKSETQVVADAFKTVSGDARYRVVVGSKTATMLPSVDLNMVCNRTISCPTIFWINLFREIDDSRQHVTVLLEMVLVLFEMFTHQKCLLMAPITTEEGSFATLSLMQESLGQRLEMESIGTTLWSLFGSALVRDSKFRTIAKMSCRHYSCVRKRHHNQQQRLLRVCINSYRLMWIT
jgi:hypothetical protein